MSCDTNTEIMESLFEQVQEEYPDLPIEQQSTIASQRFWNLAQWSLQNHTCSKLWVNVSMLILSQERKSLKFFVEFVTTCWMKVESAKQLTIAGLTSGDWTSLRFYTSTSRKLHLWSWNVSTQCSTHLVLQSCWVHLQWRCSCKDNLGILQCQTACILVTNK